jgi:transglutaminase-like putative cysteine protease
MKSGSIDGLFPDCLSQRVGRADERTAEITVRAIRPDRPAKLEGSDQAQVVHPSAEDLAANNFIQSDDREVIALATTIAPEERDPWKLACDLEKFVDAAIQTKSYSQAFATAAEVARSLEGDCTEHSLLYAALCRQRKIPARVAFGFVYYPPARGFAGHMWNEVWISDRWIPMDSTLGQGGIGAERIKLGDSNLSGGSPLVEMLSVIQVIGRLELKILSAE